MLGISLNINAQDISRIEYFFDNDPGFGNGTEITGYTQPNADLSNYSTVIDASILTDGIHILFVRTKNTANIWSQAYRQTFLKMNAATNGNITRLEYFFDNDPGHGNGTEITGYAAGNDIVNFNTNLNASALSQGIHTLFVRSKDDWSITARQTFLKQNIPSIGDITRLEYFFDNDPGHGNGTEITGYTAGNDIINFNTNLNASALSQGIHTLFVRSKDDWSITAHQTFLKQNIPSIGDITRLEYFFDNDPGHGNGTEITGYTAGNDIVNFNTNLNASALSQGIHTLFVRSKDDWSITARQTFLKQNLVAIGDITRLEYFFDNDPGHGNGTEITGYTAGNDIVNFNTNLNASALSQGIHTLFVRSKDDWSITARQIFLKQNLESNTNITAIEYFFDKDPGAGNGTQITITPNTDIANLLTPIDFSSQSNGQHYFFIRTQNADGEWSITQATLINKDVLNPLPLNWISFEVTLQNKIAKLYWQTSEEINTQSFEIQRSTDAKKFEKIGEIYSTNNKSEQSSYQFIDEKMLVNINYYRIKQIDIDGKFAYSTIKQAINENSNNFTIENNGSHQPILVSNIEAATIQVFNESGKLVKEISSKAFGRYNVDNLLNSGIYLAVLSKNGIVIEAKKIAIIK
jgi:cytochrome b subunit of formate dehydrogenase